MMSIALPGKEMIDRRGFLLGARVGFGAALTVAATRAVGASAANQWFALTGDDGHPVPNIRLPVELVAEIDDLPGAVWGGGGPNPTVTLVSFYDHNCPWCRAAVRDLAGLMRAHPDLRVGLVCNPILSPASVQAAKVELAMLQLKGAAAAHGLYDRLFAGAGRVDGPRALVEARRLGADPAALEREADGEAVRETLRRQMRLAASMGLVATPSYVIGGAGVLGYPGPLALDRIVSETRACGTIAC